MHNIRVLREKMGLSQQQVAEAVHVASKLWQDGKVAWQSQGQIYSLS